MAHMGRTILSVRVPHELVLTSKIGGEGVLCFYTEPAAAELRRGNEIGRMDRVVRPTEERPK
jgi:hypothetical protein